VAWPPASSGRPDGLGRDRQVAREGGWYVSQGGTTGEAPHATCLGENLMLPLSARK